MKKQIPALSNHSIEEQDATWIKQKIQELTTKIQNIEQRLTAFENSLRSHLIDQLIEEQELSVLYKKQKKEKKEKRLAQKKRGKNYKEKTGITPISQKAISSNQIEEKASKKKLYREAMLHVHPDKFSMNECNENIANEITTKLIEIYQHGTLEELQNYHSHIFSNNINLLVSSSKSIPHTTINPNEYLRQEKQKLEQKLAALKAKHTYKVLMEYKNPMSFLEELQEYYADRLIKLRKRTRMKKK